MIKIHLSRLLGERRISQAELARHTGIRPNTISAIYNERVDRLTVWHLNRICEFLGCRLDELMEYIPDKFPTTGENLIIDDHGNKKRNNKNALRESVQELF